MNNRLQQFWTWGHNCRVLALTADEVETVLWDFRFTPWAFSKTEKSAFYQGFNHTPLQWTRDDIKPVCVRPILHEPLEHMHPVLVKHRPKTIHSNEAIQEIRKKSQAFWDSQKGTSLKRQMSLERRGHNSKRYGQGQ